MEQEQSVWHTYSSFMKMVQNQAENVEISKSLDSSNQGDFSKHDDKDTQENVMYACNFCDHLTMEKQSLERHIQSKHEGVKFACNQCDYQATTQSSLTRHIQSIHEGVKYACNQCDYQATQQGSLSRHMKRHL